jgi:hypothetical protein
MLSDRNDREGLRPFLAFAFVDGETHLVSHSEFVEALVCDCIAMEVDIRTITSLDEAIVLFGEEIRDPSVARGRMSLCVSAVAANMVLESSAHRIEAIAYRNINVLMSVMLGRIALHYDLLARNL